MAFALGLLGPLSPKHWALALGVCLLAICRKTQIAHNKFARRCPVGEFKRTRYKPHLPTDPRPQSLLNYGKSIPRSSKPTRALEPHGEHFIDISTQQTF